MRSWKKASLYTADTFKEIVFLSGGLRSCAGNGCLVERKIVNRPVREA